MQDCILFDYPKKSVIQTTPDLNLLQRHAHLLLLDTVPFVQAVQNPLQPYLQQGLDIFKTCFSVSGVAKLQMMKKI